MPEELKIPENMETINEMFPRLRSKLCEDAKCPNGRCNECILDNVNHKQFTKWFKDQINNS